MKSITSYSSQQSKYPTSRQNIVQNSKPSQNLLFKTQPTSYNQPSHQKTSKNPTNAHTSQLTSMPNSDRYNAQPKSNQALIEQNPINYNSPTYFDNQSQLSNQSIGFNQMNQAQFQQNEQLIQDKVAEILQNEYQKAYMEVQQEVQQTANEIQQEINEMNPYLEKMSAQELRDLLTKYQLTKELQKHGFTGIEVIKDRDDEINKRRMYQEIDFNVSGDPNTAKQYYQSLNNL